MEVEITDSPTSADTSKKKVRESKNSGLKKCFSALVDRKQVNVELEVLRLMLRTELQINVDSLEPELANLLPYLLVYYIKTWPGWQRSTEYFSGKIPFKNWYDKFYKFITLKLSENINTHYRDIKNDIQKEKVASKRKLYMLKKVCDRNTQTDNLAPKVMAPFTIHIMAKPVLLNTIVFTDTNEGDVILKRHNALDWDQTVLSTISLKQLISWPHVGVHLITPVFSFSRRNLHEYRRQISLAGTPLPSLTTDFIDEIKVIDPKHNRSCYTLDYLKDVANDLVSAVKCIYTAPNVPEAFETVINEFLVDIEDINVLRDGKHTMASNTSVLYNIGKNSYFRNKKLSKGHASRYDLGYTEVILPKMETALVRLDTEEQIQNYIASVKKFAQDKSNDVPPISLPQITFSCCFCQKNFNNGGLLTAHLRDEHKMEQQLLCAYCRKSYLVFDLTISRWSHECNAVNKKKDKQSN